jgi:hypothetical protein
MSVPGIAKHESPRAEHTCANKKTNKRTVLLYGFDGIFYICAFRETWRAGWAFICEFCRYLAFPGIQVYELITFLVCALNR